MARGILLEALSTIMCVVAMYAMYLIYIDINIEVGYKLYLFVLVSFAFAVGIVFVVKGVIKRLSV